MSSLTCLCLLSARPGFLPTPLTLVCTPGPRAKICISLTALPIAERKDKVVMLLQKLDIIPYRQRKDRNPPRVDGTCEWFTNHKHFQAWQEGDTSKLLWVSADPGCGKSVLARYLVDSVLQTTDSKTICYFFFKDDFEDQRNIGIAMCAILRQLFDQKPSLASNKIIDTITSKGETLTSSFSDLWDILLAAATNGNSGEIVCVLDALDECDESGRAQLADALRSIDWSESGPSLKILLTSRPYAELQRDFRLLEIRHCLIHLSGENEAEVDKISQEIDLVIEKRVEELTQRLQLEPSEKEFLHVELEQVPNRTYLWVHLVINDILNSIEITKDGIRSTIRNIPKTVAAAYEKILSRSRDWERARKLLHVVVAAREPLTLKEMAEALAVNERTRSHADLILEPESRFRTTVRDLCGLFVTIIGTKIYLLHQTAREFLVQDAEPAGTKADQDALAFQWKHSLRPSESNMVLAETCIRYLHFSDLTAYSMVEDDLYDYPDIQPQQSINNYVLLDYARRHWDDHVRYTHEVLDPALLRLLPELCDPSADKFRMWAAARYWKPSGGQLTAIRIAVDLRLRSLVRLFIKQGVDLDGQFLLGHAARLESLDIAKDLIDGGVQIDELGAHAETALSVAAQGGDTALARLLLDRGADIEARSYMHETPLHLALTLPSKKDMVELLLDYGANINPRSANGRTPLAEACIESARLNLPIPRRRPLHIFKRLLDRGADVDVADSEGLTSLCHASMYLDSNIIDLLLRNGANVDAKDTKGFTALSHAATSLYSTSDIYSGRETMQILLRNGANIEAKDEIGRTPLALVAMLRNNPLSVGFLLSQGANIEAVDNNSRTALIYAAAKGNHLVVQLLLENKANIEARDAEGRTALSYAAEYPHDRMMDLLLKGGADPEAKGNSGRTPLSFAAEYGQVEAAKLLLGKRAGVDAADNRGRTPLSYSTRYGHVKMLQLLLDKGANIQARDREGRTALSYAAQRGQEDVIKVLVERGADTSARDWSGRTPLDWALRRNDDTVKRLLERKECPEFRSRLDVDFRADGAT